MPLLALATGDAGSVPVDDALSRKVQNRFIAPCCWQESVAVHQSETAVAMREEITRLTRQGMSEDQIVARYVSRYGERILWAPRGRRYIWLVVMPIAALLAGSLLLAYYLLRHRRAQPAAAPGAAIASVTDDELEF